MAVDNMPVNALEALDGIMFPVAKVQIITYADEHGASEETLEALRALPVQNYRNLQEINAHLGEIEDQPGSENLWSSNAQKKEIS